MADPRSGVWPARPRHSREHGYNYLHVAIDDHSLSRPWPTRRSACARFLRDSAGFLTFEGVTIERATSSPFWHADLEQCCNNL